MNKEQEYNEFMAKLCHKAHEVNQDYQKLSSENKKRVDVTVENLVRAHTVMESINYFSLQYSCRNVLRKF